jgi:hypothetical protein
MVCCHQHKSVLKAPMSLGVTALLLLVTRLEDAPHDPAAVAAIAREFRDSLLAVERDPVQRLGLPLELELERVVSLRTAAILRDVSIDTMARHFTREIVRTGGKVRGLKLKHALGLDANVPELPRPRAKRRPFPPRKRRTAETPRKVLAVALATADSRLDARIVERREKIERLQSAIQRLTEEIHELELERAGASGAAGGDPHGRGFEPHEPAIP